MKKVLFVSHTANFSKFNRPFMRWFHEQGFEVHYASAGEERVLDCDKHFTIPFERSPFSIRNLKAIYSLRKIIQAENYLLVHCHTPVGSVVARLAARTERKKGTKIVYTAHGFHFFRGAPKINWLLFYPIEKFLSKYTDCIVTINQEDYELASSKFHSKLVKKINGVGVDLSRFTPVDEQTKRTFRRERNYNNDDFILICVAEFTKNKNQQLIIQAAEKLVCKIPSLKIVFAGCGEYLQECRALVMSLGLENFVEFVGYRKDIEKWYNIADVGISASLREGLPINIVEEMASGLPVICARIRGQIDVVTDQRNGYLYDTDNVDQFCAAVLKLYENRNSLLNIEKACREDAQLYSVADAIESMADIYTQVLEK